MTEQTINLAKDNISTEKVRLSHDMMIYKIKSFENECQNQLLDSKIREINSDNNILEEIIEIEKKIEDYIDSNHNDEDREQINDIMLHIESCLSKIHEKIFIKKGFLFLTSSNLEFLKERMEWNEFFSTNEEANLLNELVTVNNLFVSTRVIDK